MLKKFLDKVKNIILTHINDEDFNVGKLAEYLNLSRSQTFRKIKALTGFSANEYIREVRLKKALELLKDENLTISEISYRVGFNNPSYFNKCFHEKYNYSPGEYREKILAHDFSDSSNPNKIKSKNIVLVLVVFISLFFVIWWYQVEFNETKPEQYSSIAVIPLQDYSKNQDKEYLALALTNGITSELSKIKELTVSYGGISWFVGDSLKNYDEIAKELNVELLLEGSIYSEGEQLRLIVTLIDPTPSEHQVWQKVYRDSTTNLLELSASLSSDIAEEINKKVINKKLNFLDSLISKPNE